MEHLAGQDAIIRHVSPRAGARIVRCARERFLNRDWVRRTLASYPAGRLPDCDLESPFPIREFQGNMSELMIEYAFENGVRLVAKVFLPVLISSPTIAFRASAERGRGIDVRMNVFRNLLPADGRFRVPRAHVYDETRRVLWMEHIGVEFRPLEYLHRVDLFEAMGAALASVHECSRQLLRNGQLRISKDVVRADMLVQYPFRYLEPFLTTASLRRRWSEFLATDGSVPPGLIHGDLCRKNLCYAQRDGTVWFLDFERSNIASPAYDVGFFLADALLSRWSSGADENDGCLIEFLANYLSHVGERSRLTFRVACYAALALAYRSAVPARVGLSNADVIMRARGKVEELLARDSPELEQLCR